MELKTSIFKRGDRPRVRTKPDGSTRTQMLKGGWFYRIRYHELNGKARTKEHGPFRTKLEAKDALDIAARKFQLTGGESRRGERMTFAEFADDCELSIFAQAELVNGTWEGGLRSSRSAKSLLRNLRSFFGRLSLDSITATHLGAYRKHRLSGGVSPATANRELAIMRRMMRHALAEGLVVRDIFKNAKVILASSEKPRERILTRAEESRLLAFSEGEHEIEYTRKWKGKEQTLTQTAEVGGKHLKALIVLALDTGMRRGELLSLTWADVDFQAGIINLRGAYTKTLTSRIAPLSERAAAELERLRPDAFDPAAKIFAITDFKRSWTTAKRLAGIVDLNFHDLRKTFVTRQLAAGVSPLIVSKIVGHSQLQTTMRAYTVVDIGLIKEAAERINALNAQDPNGQQQGGDFLN